MDSIKYNRYKNFSKKFEILQWAMFGSSSRTIIQTQTSKIGPWAQNQAYMAIPVLWPEPCRTWVNWREEAPSWICESKGSGVILDEGMVSDLLSGVLWPEPCRTWVNWREEAPSWSCESKGSGVILDEGMVSDLLSGVLWPEPCRTWVNWREKAPSWICESEGSGVILDEGMISDLSLGVL